MPVVAMVNHKGGTGKTTLSINLAFAFAEIQPTLLMDADPQGSALDCADSRATPQMNLDACAVEPSALLRDVRRLATRYGWIIIDGPPGIGRVSVGAVRAADVVLIPSKPSPFDVWVASDIVEAVRDRQETTGGIPKGCFVIAMVRPRTRLVGQVNAALAEYGLPVLEARTSERVVYLMTAIEGKSVLDSRDMAARGEILAMRDEIERLSDEHAQQAQSTR